MNLLPLLSPETLPDWSKEQLLAYADELVATRHEEGYDVLGLLAQAAKIELLAQRIKEQAKPLIVHEVRQYGKGGVMRAGVTLTVREQVTCNYSNDPVWQSLNMAAQQATQAKKAQEETLKTLPYTGRIMADETTGEEYRAYPPARQGGDIVCVSIQ